MKKNYYYYNKNIPEMVVYNRQHDRMGYCNSRGSAVTSHPEISSNNRIQLVSPNRVQQAAGLRESVSTISHRKPTVAKCKKMPDVFKDPVNDGGFALPLSAAAGLFTC